MHQLQVLLTGTMGRTIQLRAAKVAAAEKSICRCAVGLALDDSAQGLETTLPVPKLLEPGGGVDSRATSCAMSPSRASRGC